MIDVMRIGLTKEHLLKMKPEERSLFLLLGYGSNQVNVLWKLVIEMTNRNPSNPVDERVSSAQTQIIVRLLIGVLRETWGLIEKRFLGTTLGKEFVPTLDPEASQALERLKVRFRGANPLIEIRNNYAFHYPDLSDMETAFQRSVKYETNDDDWSIYFCRTLLNCFFFVSDFVIAHGMADAAGEEDLMVAHKKILNSLGPLSNDLSEFSFGFAASIFRKYMGQELTATIVAKIDDAPRIDDVRVPFYVETEGISVSAPSTV
jgi:hypothetical protein